MLQEGQRVNIASLSLEKNVYQVVISQTTTILVVAFLCK